MNTFVDKKTTRFSTFVERSYVMPSNKVRDHATATFDASPSGETAESDARGNDRSHFWKVDKSLLRMPQGAGRRLDRLTKLIALVENESRVHLAKASTYLNVSEMTIRRDIMDCGGRLGLLGGYIVLNTSPNQVGSYDIDHENVQRASLKEEACLAALKLIEKDDILFIDCGTTTPYLARHLPDDKNLTVICYSLNIAEILCRTKNVRVLLLGGLYHSVSETFAGDESIKFLEKIGITKAFLSAGGVHPVQGASCSYFHEVGVKQAVIRNAAKKYLIIDSTKFNRLKLAFFSPLQAFDGIATDSEINASDFEIMESQKISVVRYR